MTRPIEARSLPSFAAVLVTRGAGSLATAAAGLQTVAAPALFWLFPNRVHSYGPDEAGWDERWILFEGTLTRDFVGLRLLVETAPVVRLRAPGETQRLFSALHADLLDDTTIGRATAAARLHRIVVEVARQAAAPIRQAPDVDLQRAVEILRRQAFGHVDMTRLAATFGMSPATLRRRFSAETGLSPKSYQLRLRLDRAKELLVTTDATIEEISRAVGMDDPFYFSRLFRSREHCAPSEFRERHRRS